MKNKTDFWFGVVLMCAMFAMAWFFGGGVFNADFTVWDIYVLFTSTVGTIWSLAFIGDSFDSFEE